LSWCAKTTKAFYTGAGGFLFKGTPHEVAIQESVNTRRGVERCLKYAFDLAQKRRDGKPWKGLQPEHLKAGKTAQLTLCGKTNVLTYAFDLWWRAFQELAPKYPAVKTDYAHVDATCMWFVKNPEWFDVIVTDNMFGDIITDLAAIIQGGLGVAAGGNINPKARRCLSRWAAARRNTPDKTSSTRSLPSTPRHDAGFPGRSESRSGH